MFILHPVPTLKIFEPLNKLYYTITNKLSSRVISNTYTTTAQNRNTKILIIQLEYRVKEGLRNE